MSRAHEVQRRAACGAEPVEEALQRLGLAFAADPQQTLAVAVDLIDQRQVALPAAARELVDADGLDVREVAVREAPVDGHAHGPIDGVPGRGERRGDLLPRQALGPSGGETRRRRRSVGACRWPTGRPRPALRSAGRTRGASRRGRPRGCATGARSRSAGPPACRSPGPDDGIASTSRGSRHGAVPGPRGSAAGAPPAAPSRRRTPSASEADSR